MTYRYRIVDGMKSINPWDLDSNKGWTIAGEETTTGETLYFRRVPWLWRGVQDRAASVSAMPYRILRGETEVDPTKDANLAWMKGIVRLLKKIEQSLSMTGRAYLFLETNPAGYIKNVRYCKPTSVTEVYDRATGEVAAYKRSLRSGLSMDVPKSNIVAIYDQDYTTEEGPSDSSAAKAALAASGVLFNSDEFIANYFKRGAIRATVLGVDGGSPQEAERLQNWWSDVVTGIKNAWAAIVVRFSLVKPTIIGDGLEGLQNDSLSASKRQDIATALGIPESRLWSAAANYATADADTKNYYRSTIIPECDLIAEALSEQVFVKEHKLDGYAFEFNADSLDIFQVDANEQATAALNFAGLLEKSPTADFMIALCGQYGIELTPDMEKAITAYYTDKEQRQAEMDAQMQEQQAAPTPQAEPDEDDSADEQPPNPQETRAALAAWKRKAIHAMKEGQPASVEFITSVIPARTQEALRYELDVCTTPDEVKRVFDAIAADPEPAVELKRLNDLIVQYGSLLNAN